MLVEGLCRKTMSGWLGAGLAGVLMVGAARGRVRRGAQATANRGSPRGFRREDARAWTGDGSGWSVDSGSDGDADGEWAGGKGDVGVGRIV